MVKVYTLYCDEETVKTIVSRLIEHSFSFNYTGEFLYSNTPWDDFIKEFCQDVAHMVVLDKESWSDNSLGFEIQER